MPEKISGQLYTFPGYYMYIETAYPREEGDKAILNSPKLQFSGSMCLKFYYHMYGSDIGTLNVIINGNKVFRAVGDNGNRWLIAAIDLNLSGKQAVRCPFNATTFVAFYYNGFLRFLWYCSDIAQCGFL